MMSRLLTVEFCVKGYAIVCFMTTRWRQLRDTPSSRLLFESWIFRHPFEQNTSGFQLMQLKYVLIRLRLASSSLTIIFLQCWWERIQLGLLVAPELHFLSEIKLITACKRPFPGFPLSCHNLLSTIQQLIRAWWSINRALVSSYYNRTNQDPISFSLASRPPSLDPSIICIP